jgi:hypothetical protein
MAARIIGSCREFIGFFAAVGRRPSAVSEAVFQPHHLGEQLTVLVARFE